MIKLSDITGMQFGKLSVLSRADNKPDGRTAWNCHCECGTELVARGAHLSSGQTKSCGCDRVERIRKLQWQHGLSRTPEYHAWCGMSRRCYNKDDDDYQYYGAQGVTVCDRWRASFLRFLEDMGRRPSTRHSIDRIDPFGNYEPDNCRWATARTQRLNQRRCMAHRESV